MTDNFTDPRLPILDEIGDALYAAAATGEQPRRKRRWRPSFLGRRGRSALVVVAVLVCGSGSAGGLALAGSFNATAEDPQAWVNGQRVAPAQTIAPDQSAGLAILRRPRDASDVMPAAMVAGLTVSPADANGPNPALSRRAQGLTDGAAWVVPGDGMICLVTDGGGTCQPDASVADGKWPVMTGGSSKAPGMTAVAGLVPDGVDQVVLTLGDGSTQTIAVHENVYLATVHGGLRSVSYTGPDGVVTLNN
jgi:hypothetical protein